MEPSLFCASEGLLCQAWSKWGWGSVISHLFPAPVLKEKMFSVGEKPVLNAVDACPPQSIEGEACSWVGFVVLSRI